MEGAQEPCGDQGQDGRGKCPLAAEPKPPHGLHPCTQEAPRKELPYPRVITGDRKPVEAPEEAGTAGTDAEKACQTLCSEALHKERNLDSSGTLPPGEGWPRPLRETKPEKRPLSPASEKQKRPEAEGLVSSYTPGVLNSPQGARALSSSGSGQGPCPLTHVVSNLGQNSQGAEPKKRPPEVPCPIRKKTRTLYRADQLEELERIFQEDHYPDGDKRREISQTVGVTPQRIMVWFQNRRAKWRKEEKLNGKESKGSPPPAVPVPSPASTHSQSQSQCQGQSQQPQQHQQHQQQHSSAAEFPATFPLEPEAGPFPPEPSLDVLPEPPVLLMSDQTMAPLPQNEGAQRAAMTPLLFSPPPVQRTSLPLPLGPGHKPQPLPLPLDPVGGCSSHKEGPCGSWGPSLTPPPHCSYLEELEPQDYQQSSHLAPFQVPSMTTTLQSHLFQAPQPQFPFLPPFPTFHLPSSLTPPLLDDPLCTFSQGSSGGISQSYFQGPPSGQILLQAPSGNPGAVPWNDLFLPELPFPSPFCPSAMGQLPGGDGYFSDLFPVPCAPPVSIHPSPGHSQLPEETEPLPGRVSEGQQLPVSSKEQSLVSEEAQEEDRHSHIP